MGMGAVCVCVCVCKRAENECGIVDVCVCTKGGQVDFAAEVRCGRLAASEWSYL